MKSNSTKQGNMQPIKTHSGFTIVELLIVIVVIGILAAISIVAYNGIQNRANDTAVKNDISAMAKKLHLAAAEAGEFIDGGISHWKQRHLPRLHL